MQEQSDQTPPNTTTNTDTGNSDETQRENNNNNNNVNENGNNQRQQHNRNNRNNKQSYASNHNKEWKGDCSDLALVLGIKPEKLTHQTSVDGLLEQLESYIKRHFDFSEDVTCIFANEDPIIKLQQIKDTLITDEQKTKIAAGDPFENALMKDTITRYGNRNLALTKNIGKIFELIWGQCTTSICTLLKGEENFQTQRRNNDVK